MKKLIGYQLKPECKEYELAALTIAHCTDCGWNDFYEYKCFLPIYDDGVEKLKNSNLLDIWFIPIYRKFKVGDWVCETWDASPDQEKAYQIVKIKEGNIFYTRDYISQSRIDQFRFASKAEIQEAKDELLKIAKINYPIGTKFIPAHINSKDDYCIVTNDNFVISEKMN